MFGNILHAAGSVMSLFPYRRPETKFSFSYRDHKSAADALRHDWEMIGKDLAKSIEIEKTRLDEEK